MKGHTLLPIFLMDLVSQLVGLGREGYKVVKNRNLIWNQRSRFVSVSEIGLSFSQCSCLFWNEYLRWNLRERPAALCWKVIFKSIQIQVESVFHADGVFSLPEKMQQFIIDRILLRSGIYLIYLCISGACNNARYLVSKHFVNVCWN